MVYEAFDRREQSTVALKVLRTAEADALYRFKKDFRSLADLRHPNLVRFYELFTEEGVWFFSMELVPGVDFIEWLTGEPAAEGESTSRSPGQAPEGRTPGGRTPDYRRVRQALRQLARGLHAVHRNGMVHRDVKPTNVLVTGSAEGAIGPRGAGPWEAGPREAGPRVVLLDFGLATELRPVAAHPSAVPLMVGTPAYMSPEQAFALPGTPAGDWYGVGVMLYQALARELPFQGSVAEVMAAKQFAEPPDLRLRLPDLPADLEALCRGLLDPDAETRLPGAEVLRRLEASPDAPADRAREPGKPDRRSAPDRGTGGRRPAFVGRRDLLAGLAAALEESRGGAVVVHVRGPSGIGKTALLQRFSAGVDDGTVILTGRCYLQESVPYKALDNLIDNLSRYLLSRSREEVAALLPDQVAALTRLFPVLQRVEALAAAADRRVAAELADPQRLRRQAFAALRQLLARLAADRPLALLIDDLQWGDAESAALLDELFRGPDPPALLFVACYRSEDEPTSPFLRALAEHREALSWRGVRVREVELGELSGAESAELVHALERQGHAVPPERVAELVREAAGSPLYLGELARDSGSGAEIAAGEAPPGGRLRQLLRRRIDELAPASRRLLEAIAVAGKPLDLEAARQAADLVSAPGEALAELRTRRLARQLATGSSDEVETYHDHVRETVLAGFDRQALRRVHRRLALALESSGVADPETLAVHYRAVGEVARARAYAVAAAARAEEALAFERAARLYRLALDLATDDDGERYRIEVRLGAALANAGRSREAAEVYLRAVRRSGDSDPLEVQRHAAEKLLISGHIDRGLAVLRHVLRQVDMGFESRRWKLLLDLWWKRLRLRLGGYRFRPREEAECDPAQLRRIDVCWSVEIGLCLVDVLHAAEFHARYLLMALAAGEPRRLARGLAMEIFFAALDGRDTATVEDLAGGLAQRLEDRTPRCLTAMASGMAACSRGRWGRADDCLARAEAELREIGTGGAWELDTVHHFRVIALLALGRWRALFAELPSLLEPAQAQGNLYLELHLRHWVESLRELAGDRPERARKILRHTLPRWSQEGFHYQHFGHLYAAVQTDLYRRRGRRAWDRVAARWDDLAESRIQTIEMVLVQSHDLLGRSALAAAGEVDGRQRRRFLARVAASRRRLEGMRSTWSRALGAVLGAGVAEIRGARREARSRLESAATDFAASGMAVHGAVVRRRLAELAGAAAELAAADFELRDLGVRNPRRMSSVLAPGRQ